MTDGTLDRFADAIVRFRWPILGLALVVMLAVPAGAGFVGVTNDYRSLFDTDNPQLAALNALEDTYGTLNRALIAMVPRKGSVFTRGTLGVIEELTEAAWRAPHSTRVDSLTNYSHSHTNGDELIVEPLVEDAGALAAADLERVRESRSTPSRLPGAWSRAMERQPGSRSASPCRKIRMPRWSRLPTISTACSTRRAPTVPTSPIT